MEILSARNEELLRLMDSLKSEFDETEKLVIELATQFNDGVAELQDEDTEVAEVASSEGVKVGPNVVDAKEAQNSHLMTRFQR